MWALGYFVDELYHVADGVIAGVHHLDRAGGAIARDGRFRSARFEKRAADVTRLGVRWRFDDNPFARSPELSGLKVVVTLLANWDTKPGNSNVLQVRRADGTLEHRYLLADIGAAFGRMARSRWNLEDYRTQDVVQRIERGIVVLNYRGDGIPPPVTIPLAHARWFAGLVSQLTDEQVRRAFEASGATPPEVAGFSETFLHATTASPCTM